ncbi:hypothetical protein EVAR_40297_1 [Eumeta japonica]|uniref:Nucleic-acid-binding protein from transposon X-element n=1 Tax=Eumeta variegata TaxID=151549 RepID=A0A4C1Y9V2_EUMVA|nr:hypothetical protein EVAR_40297_1 [Eumeta japonica]
MPRQTETPEGASVAPVGGLRSGSVLPTIPPPSPALGRQYGRRPQGRKRAPRNRGATAANRAAVKSALTREARDELEALRNISREVKTSVCEKLQRIAALARQPRRVSLPPHSGGGTGETKRARDLEAAENDKDDGAPPRQMSGWKPPSPTWRPRSRGTQDAIDRMDIPNKLEGLRKTLEIKPTTYAAAAAKPKLQAAAKPQVPGPRSPLPTPLSSRPDAPTTPVTRSRRESATADVRETPRVPSGPRGVARAIYASHKTGYVYVGLQRRPVWDQSPLVQCSRCLGFGHSKKWCREQNDKCAHCGNDHTGPTCPDRKAAQPQSA